MKYRISAEQEKEIEEARRGNKNKRIEKRLRVLAMRAKGIKLAEIAKAVGYSRPYVSELIAMYCTEGISVITENHYSGNRRNMSVGEEAELLDGFRKEAEAGKVIEVRELKAAYQEKVGHTIGGSQIYYVLQRHGWRKVMPRSKHPNKASEEVIEASKKLTVESEN